MLYIKASRIENQLRAQRTISGLTWTSCIISVYVLDEAGLPFERTAIKPRNVSIIKASQFKGVESELNYYTYQNCSGISTGVFLKGEK